jgi:hypothetical protein
MPMLRSTLLVVLAAPLVAGCAGDDETELPPAETASICLGGEELQTMGGKGLDAIIEAREETGPPVSEPTLDRVVRGAFAVSLRHHLRELVAAGGDTDAVVAAAEEALQRVEESPELLTDEVALERAFAEAQRLADSGDYTSAGCSASI